MANPSQSSGFTVPSWAVAVIVSIITNMVLFAFYQGRTDGRITNNTFRIDKLEKRMDGYDASRDQQLAQYEREYKERTQQEVGQMQVLVKRLLELEEKKN